MLDLALRAKILANRNKNKSLKNKISIGLTTSCVIHKHDGQSQHHSQFELKSRPDADRPLSRLPPLCFDVSLPALSCSWEVGRMKREESKSSARIIVSSKSFCGPAKTVDVRMNCNCFIQQHTWKDVLTMWPAGAQLYNSYCDHVLCLSFLLHQLNFCVKSGRLKMYGYPW